MFISYAQNFEDIILWRALHHIESGFYVDVGAMDPEVDSVTKAFYDRGWTGINIEPIEFYFKRIVENRPRDTNCKLAAGNAESDQFIYEVENSGLSTLDVHLAESLRLKGWLVNQRKIQTITLNSLLDRSVVNQIHFLKIDVEGYEKEVLEGLDLQIWRPWIILVEATIQNTKDPNYLCWESSIVNNNYHFIYFDGLNRFYISNEHAELDKAFSSPPNIFDEFISAHHKSAIDQLEKNQEVIQNFENQIHQLNQNLKLTQNQLNQYDEIFNEKNNTITRLEQNLSDKVREIKDLEFQLVETSQKADFYFIEYEKILGSRSWRITKPLRDFVGLFRRIIAGFSKTKFKQKVFMLLFNMQSIPVINSWLMRIKKKHPKFWKRIKDTKVVKFMQNFRDNYVIGENFTDSLNEDTQYFVRLFTRQIQIKSQE